LEQVDAALAAGRITDAQAAKARERINNGQGFRPGALREHGRGVAKRVRTHIVGSAAEAIGITPEELRAELREGNSIAGVAAERGISADAVATQITADSTEKLAARVSEGRITQAQADAALARLAERMDEILNRSREPAGTP
jgi:hypothetical protein